MIDAPLGVARNYFTRIACIGRPYAKRPEMEQWLRAQPRERLAKCVQNLAVIGQGKAYLYWRTDWEGNTGK